MELLKLAVTGSHPRFSLVSGGRQWLSEHEDDELVAKELAHSLGYSQTKFVSEVITKRAAYRCPPGLCNISIIKPGLIIGTLTEGIANKDDYVWRLTAACIGIGAYNEKYSNEWLVLSDASSLASLVIDSAFSPEIVKPVQHVTDGITWGQFWSVIGGMGYSLAPKSASVWLSAIRDDLVIQREDHPLWPLSYMFESSDDDTIVIASDRDDPPPLHLRIAIRKNVECLIRAGFIPLPDSNIGITEVRTEVFSRSTFE